MITFVCVWVQGHVNFPVVYVERLKSMIERRTSLAHRFVCITDQVKKVPKDTIGIEARLLPLGTKAWWVKTQLFDPGFQNIFPGTRFVYLDLDVLLVGNIDPIVDFNTRFALIPDGAPEFKGHGELRTVKAFNSSVMVWNEGEGQEIFARFNHHIEPKRLWGDQDLIGETYPRADKMPLEWFPRISSIDMPPFDPPDWPAKAKIVLMKKPKNLIAASMWPWFDREWR